MLVTVLRGGSGSLSDVPAEEYAAVVGFILLPFVGYAATKITHGGFTPRYVLTSVLGIAIAAAYLAKQSGRTATVLMLSFMAVMMGFREARYWMLDAHLPAAVTKVEEDVLQTAATTDLPLVISNGHDYLPMAYYDHGTDRFLTLVDPESAIKFRGSDNVDLTMLAVQRLLPLDVQQYREFASRHSRFLLYSSGDEWNWWPERFRSDGAVLRPLLIHESRAIKPDRTAEPLC
jgi:hypothetical protein